MHFPPTDHIFSLDTKDMQELTEIAEHIDSKELLSAFLMLPIKQLIDNDLLIRLYKNASNAILKNAIKYFIIDNREQIKKCQSLALLALLMVIENEPIICDGVDCITLNLLAWYYRESDHKNNAILKNLDETLHPTNELHLLLAAKIDTKLYHLLSKKFYADLRSEPENINKISYLQNTIYIKNRTDKLYPSLYGLTKGENNSWSFWQGKHKAKNFSLEKKLYLYALNYMHEREITLSNGQVINLPFSQTTQYITSPSALKNITEISWLLSQQARESAEMFFASSNNTPDDKLKGDSNLICTAPLGVMQGIYNNSMAKITFDLARIPVSKLKNCIIKMCDYMARSGNLTAIAITPTIQMQVLYFESDCDLITMTTDPKEIAFENLPLEKGLNAFLLFNDTLYYVDRTNKKLIHIILPSENESELALLKSKFHDSPSRLQQDDRNFFYQLTGYTPQIRTTSRYLFTSEAASYTLSLPSIHELYHGINGFREALTHFLFVINALPNDGAGKILKDEIMAYMHDLKNAGNLNDYLDWIFRQLFNYMEIDFPYGLPLSLEYTSSVEFLNFNTPKINFEEIFRLSKKGTLGNYEPELICIPGIMQQVLKAVSPEYFPSMTAFLEAQYPESFILALHRWPELLSKNIKELKIYINQMPQLRDNTVDLTATIALFKKFLLHNPQLCQDLITTNSDDLHKLLNKLKILYQHFTFAGGESKLRELFLDVDIMSLLTSKNGEIIAAITALGIYNEQNMNALMDTTVQIVISQRTGMEIIITMESILEHLLMQPLLFLEAYPINSPLPAISNMKIHTKNVLLGYIKQRILFKYIYAKMEQTVIKLSEQSIDILNGEPLQQKPQLVYNVQQWPLYASQISDISWIDENFCKNPRIVHEVNTALSMLIGYIFENHTKPTKKMLVKNLLESTVLLDPTIGHLLFDSTHFPTALRGEKIDAIALADKVFSQVLVIENISDIKNLKKNQLIAIYEPDKLTIFWLDKNMIKSESHTTEEIQDFVHLLPQQGETKDLTLIQHLIKSYNCATQSMSFHELMIACANYLADNGINPSNALMAEQLALRIKKSFFDFKVDDEHQNSNNTGLKLQS